MGRTVSLLAGQSNTVLSMKSAEGIEILFIQHEKLNTMTSPKFVLCLTCLFLGKIAQPNNVKESFVRQERSFVSVETGNDLTLECFYEGDVAARFYWYKQILGEKPRLISTYYKFERNGTFHDEFKNNPRFTLDTEIGKNHLKMTNVQNSDSAAYYCASSYSFKFEFAEGTIVSVKGSGLDIPALVHQPESERVQPGGSVTLNCTVQTGTCDGEHSVYWFKNSGLIYTHGGKSDRCERKRDTQTRTCVYNLEMKSLNRSNAGTYYCAVVSCGHILFGDGTKLDVKVGTDSLVLVYLLSGALTFTTVLSGLLALLMCVINKGNSCKCTESHARATTNAEGEQNEENIHYAALREHKRNRPSRQRSNNDSECVYSRVK